MTRAKADDDDGDDYSSTGTMGRGCCQAGTARASATGAERARAGASSSQAGTWAGSRPAAHGRASRGARSVDLAPCALAAAGDAWGAAAHESAGVRRGQGGAGGQRRAGRRWRPAERRAGAGWRRRAGWGWRPAARREGLAAGGAARRGWRPAAVGRPAAREGAGGSGAREGVRRRARPAARRGAGARRRRPRRRGGGGVRAGGGRVWVPAVGPALFGP